MRHFSSGFWSLLAWALVAVAHAQSQSGGAGQAVTYTLLDGSYFVDDCLICDRLSIRQALRGTFDLVLLQDTPPLTRYAMRNIDFIASPGWTGEAHITGEGTYERFEEFARIQSMTLATQVKDALTNQLAYFTNDTSFAQLPAPLIKIGLTQTNGTLLQTFILQLFAAPVREVWFSTTQALTSTNAPGSKLVISPGDFVSNRGRVVKRNIDLAGQLGVMPIVPDLGLDAVDITSRGEILFSLTETVWSETRGWLYEDDLFLKSGESVQRLPSPLAKFGLAVSPSDAGLDAVQRMPNGEILFSLRSNVVVNSSLTLSRGDILSDQGKVFRTQPEILVNFHPAMTNRDFGLDALHILPSGEIWFSTEEGFTDNVLGTVQAGDVLSNLGYRVFSNQELVAAFAPADPSLDYGLDALFVVTDTQPPESPPRITELQHSGGAVRVDWKGEGEVFQLERAPSLDGPWQPCSSILPELFADDSSDSTNAPAGFYRVRQW